jgi:Patatin-like phospholipase
MQNTQHNSHNPLDKIALSFSGGGFRATSFCLGNLSYLNYRMVSDDKGNQETLLSRVEFISSASGGSFSNLGYAYFLYSDKPFEDCYEALKKFMTGTDLLDTVLENLNDPKVWKKYPHKGRNLINAFAIAYNEKLFNNANLGLLNNPNKVKTLREVCVNATEFEDGMSFRFQNSDGKKRKGKIGNSNLYLSTKPESLAIISKIHLADIVAASSCFPAGFEPIIFPDDFCHHQLTITELYSTIFANKQETFRSIPLTPETQKYLDETEENDTAEYAKSDLKFALMDGGIDDNQGINSMLLADKRCKEGNKFDTLIACDVGSYFMEPYLPVKEDKNTWLGKFSLTSLASIYLLTFTILIVLGFILGNNIAEIWKPILVTIGGMGLAIGVLFYLFVSSKYQKLVRGAWGSIVNKYVSYFLKIRLSVFEQMLTARAESVLKMTTSIFMIQLRRMSYQLFYSQDKWENRRITATIYELSTDEYPTTEKRFKGKLPKTWTQIEHPSKDLMQTAQQAREMGTTLWFDENNMDKRDKIIATGQFTMCFNLLVYLFEIETVMELSESLKALKLDLLKDWKSFNENPMWLV